MIATVNEGATVTNENSNLITVEALKHFTERPFVYITNRVNSYAVDPTIYKVSSRVETLAGFAVVSPSNLALRNAKYERVFLEKPFETFNTTDKAVAWAEQIVKLHNYHLWINSIIT